MNSRLSPAERRKYETEFSEFLTKRIGYAGGSIQLQHLTGHLSQLKPEIRNLYGTSKTDLFQFIKEHDNLFCIEKNSVSLVGSSLSHSGYDSDGSSVKSNSILPSKIENGKGVVVKLFCDYGFIKSKEPIKTDVYFQSSCFGSKDIDLTSFLYIGAVVFFRAKRESGAENRTKYRAIKVWKPDDGFGDNPVVPKSRKSRETGLYDALTCESDGIIQRVFPNLGFIAIKGDHNNTVFFYKNRVKGYDNVVDLTKILETGDRVEFFALRSTKPDAKARWEATKVWKIGGKEKQNAVASDKSSKINLPTAAVQPQKQSAVVSDKSSNINLPIAAMQTKTKEMIKNQTGKICPRSNGAIIKFGRDQLADGDAALYYMSGEQVTDIGWMFSEEEEVKFDAVKIKSAPGWKAVLVWVGDKPDVVLPTCIGDFSEFTDEEETEISSPVTMSKSSSYVSLSSLSSKSTSVRSERNSSKKNNSKEKYTSRSQESLNDEGVTDYRKSKSKSSRPFHEDSSSSFTTSRNSQKLKKDDKHKNSILLNRLGSNKISNWADVPYPEENFENNLTSKTNKSVKVDNIVCDNNVKKVDNKWQPPSDLEDSSDSEAENVISNSELSKDDNDLTENNSKVKPSIKRFHDMKGEVHKVYSKYAEVKSRNLEKYVSFHWSDLYTDGMSVEELEFEDLKQVLKVGDSIQFNYFVIVDDEGQSWHKVPLAWIGSKPRRCIEISPEEFIQKNKIVVTLTNETDSDEVLENKANRRKFLTAYEDVIPDNHSDKFSNTESCYEEESLPYKEPPIEPLEMLPSPKEPSERPLLLDFKNVSSTVRQMLKKIFSPDSEIDLKSVSEEIVHIISDTYNGKKSDVLCSACKGDGLNQLCKNVNTKDSEVQTIITGDIIATNIFTEC